MDGADPVENSDGAGEAPEASKQEGETMTDGENGFYAELSGKDGRSLALLGPFETRDGAERAAVSQWPDKSRGVSVSRNRFFDIRPFNPSQAAKEASK
ncbi:MAG: hypothetical protein KKA05_10280 [Alphaproteobacteria bacterium]|nr:hypothetical protein [Alphaproteobacteria bacterium]